MEKSRLRESTGYSIDNTKGKISIPLTLSFTYSWTDSGTSILRNGPKSYTRIERASELGNL